MGSQGDSEGGGSSSGRVPEKQQKLQSLCLQGSLYSLTLDEVQNQLWGLAKPVGSMNLDELLRSVSSAEANMDPLGIDPDSLGSPRRSSTQRQESFTLSRDLGRKTVDEVWRDIQQGKKKGSDSGGIEFESDNHHKHYQERQSTLGEMTLEDFLVKAGVVAQSTNVAETRDPISVTNPILASQQVHQWMHYQLPEVESQQQHQKPQKVMAVSMPGHPTVQQVVRMVPNTIVDVVYLDAQMTMSPSSLMGTLSDTQTCGRKRVVSGDVGEKTVERKQKRMIKNRESAARSRARKQAYTHELEHKVSRLEKENERLRRQREPEKAVPCAPSPQPKSQLRRTSSASF